MIERRLEMQLPLTLRRPVGPHAVRTEEARCFRTVSKDIKRTGSPFTLRRRAGPNTAHPEGARFFRAVSKGERDSA